MWKHLSYRQFKDFFGDLGLTAWVKFNWLAEVPDGFEKKKFNELTSWNYSNNGGSWNQMTFFVRVSDMDESTKCFSTKYDHVIVSGVNQIADKELGTLLNNPFIYVRDSSYTNIDEFFEGTKDTWLIYKKA